MVEHINSLAQEIRRVDGTHSLGAGALAEALMPWLAAHDRQVAERAWDEGYVSADNGYDFDENPRRSPRPAVPGVPVTGVSAEQVRTGDGPCNMLNAHGPHRWDNRDTVNLRWKCPGATVTDGGAS